MTESDKARLVRCLAGVYEFYNKELSEFTLDVWVTAMRGYDVAAVVDAFGRHLLSADTGKWLPKPADIVQMIDGGSADRAMVAWAKLDRAVRCVGRYTSVVFDDELIHRCVADMGGWASLCSKSGDEWPHVRHHFATLYRGYAGRKVDVTYEPVILGAIDLDRMRHGDQPECPVMIGHPDKCQQVMAGPRSSDDPLAITRQMPGRVKIAQDQLKLAGPYEGSK